jgi:MerR family transcriptional regulator/heat shock protein HspR
MTQSPRGRRPGRPLGQQALPPDIGVYVISVAAELTGLHPQTLRTYDRLGLVSPGRTGGGGRRYSLRDIEQLREIAELTASGIGLEGVRRILDLENHLTALRMRVRELEDQLEATEYALGQALARGERASTPHRNLPAVPSGVPGASLMVWRRPR